MRFTTTIILFLLNLTTLGLILLLQDDGDKRASGEQGLSSQISRHVIEADQIRNKRPQSYRSACVKEKRVELDTKIPSPMAR